MSPTGSTVIAAVIGSPVTHSLSPVIHNAAFEAMGLDWAYGAFEVAAGEGAAALAAMRTLGLGGLSVTMPLKDEIAQAADQLSPTARLLGAVNCVARDGDKLVGHNTDGQGFVDSFVAATDASVHNMRCLVLGAGGAARAVSAALGASGAAEVAVWNRTEDRAAAVAELAGPAGVAVEADGLSAAVQQCDLVVNGTSVGMAGTPAANASPVDPDDLRAGQFVADLVYHPHETQLLAAAAQADAVPVPGVGMLIHQAAHQLRLWTGEDPPIAVLTAAVQQALP